MLKVGITPGGVSVSGKLSEFGVWRLKIRALLNQKYGPEEGARIDIGITMEEAVKLDMGLAVDFGVPVLPPQKEHCNLHADCVEAEAEAERKKIPFRFGGPWRLNHCNDETCEDCFGS